MSFLDDIKSIDPGDAAARTAAFRHLRTDGAGCSPSFAPGSRSSTSRVRGGLAMGGRLDALSRPSTFQVTYRPHMDPSVGPFMLARDDAI